MPEAKRNVIPIDHPARVRARRRVKPTDQRLIVNRRDPHRGLVAVRMQEAREWFQLSINELSQKTGVNKATISNLEQGKLTRIEIHTLVKLADFFRLSTDYLLGRSDQKSYVPRA